MFGKSKQVELLLKDQQELRVEAQFMQELKSQLELQIIRLSRESREKTATIETARAETRRALEDVAGLERELGHAREELCRYKMLVSELMKIPTPQPQVTHIQFSGQPTPKI